VALGQVSKYLFSRKCWWENSIREKLVCEKLMVPIKVLIMTHSYLCHTLQELTFTAVLMHFKSS